MKIKTSLILSDDLIRRIDEEFGGHKNRSEFIEKAVRDYIERKIQDLMDIAIINKKAARLNREVENVLSYQTDLISMARSRLP